MVPATVEFTVRLVRHPKSFGVRCTRRTGYTCAKGTHFPKLTGYGRYLPSLHFSAATLGFRAYKT